MALDIHFGEYPLTLKHTPSVTFSAHSSEFQDHHDRLQLTYLTSATELSDSEQSTESDLYQGLTQTPKTVPARYFYNDRGSQLFEQICDLPEYYLTRTETAIFKAYADEIVQLTGPCELVELGSGSSTKTRLLLNAYQRQAQGQPIYYSPIDVSSSILELSAKQLLQDYPQLKIQGYVSTYDLALENLAPTIAPSRMICFIGSSLGNFTETACQKILKSISAALQPSEYFLLGIDLRKSIDVLEAAYNDAAGVTAAFNLNMLQHLNDRFDGDFDLDQFAHVALYNQNQHQIEMHLRSGKPQTVSLNAIDLTIQFAGGEMLRSEISRKFDLIEMSQTLQEHGLRIKQQWTDTQNWFGVLLAQKIDR